MRRFKAFVLKTRMGMLSNKISGFFLDDMRFLKRRILHCVADKCTPEEAILYVVGEEFQGARDYSDCITNPRSSQNRRTAEVWYTLAKQWRDEGGVSSKRLQEFLQILDIAKSRWPQLFSGEAPFVRKHWEVHFNYTPTGVDNDSPESKPVATFAEFADATKYVEEHSTDDYWWHSYDLLKLAREENIPEWEATPTPQQFKPMNKRGYIGYNHYWDYSASCILQCHVIPI